MASAIALTFSKVVDPKNPLYLDDNHSDVVDWEFEVLTQKKAITSSSKKQIINKPKPPSPEKSREKLSDKKETRSSILIEEISDKDVEDEEKVYNSDSSSDTSLEPYDLSDDDSDLNKNFTQLGDIAAALRKPDDPDGVSRCSLYSYVLFLRLHFFFSFFQEGLSLFVECNFPENVMLSKSCEL